MAILKYILPFLLATVLTGCYEDFTPEIDTKPVLCLNSLITAGEPIEVKVSHTWMYNDKKGQGNHEVKDATVTQLANGMIVADSYIPKAGDMIMIVADSPTYGLATAEVCIPDAPTLEEVSVIPNVTSSWNGVDELSGYKMLADITFNLNLKVGVNDRPETDNFFNFGYNWFSPAIEDAGLGIEYEGSCLSIGQFRYEAEPIFKEHVGAFESVMGNEDTTGFFFFSDRQFSGKTYALHLNYTDNTFFVRSEKYDESLLDCGMNLYLSSVSRSYYNWAVYKWHAENGILVDLSDLGLAESKWGYSNVSTGAGVVAAQSISKVTIDLKEFLKTTIDNIQ